MKILSNLNDFPPQQLPIALTIGNFDGVHLGHKAVLTSLKQAAPCSVVFTFSNHPAEVLHHTPVAHLTTLSHRLSLIEEMGIDYVVVIPFTEAFASQSAQAFLTTLKAHIPFSHLVLGHDAMMGRDRQRDLHSLCAPLTFSLTYLPPVIQDGQVVSSSAIRTSIQQGDLAAASRLLGRDYSISATVQPGHGKGRELGFHTANLPIDNLALPPLGVYTTHVSFNGHIYPALANLGHAPTVHASRPPCLEVHIPHHTLDLYGHTLNVTFRRYLRPEQRFASLDALKAQIALDLTHLSSAAGA